MNPGLKMITHARRLGPDVIAQELRSRLSSDAVCFGLRCDLGQLPPLRSASVPLTLERCDGPLDGFEAELARTTGADYGRVLRRQRLHDLGVRTMYVARTEEGEPVYVQWLVQAGDQHVLQQHASDYWPPLAADEVLLEFAYTFVSFRGMGVMADGMGQLVRVGVQRGARTAITYVRSDNVPSLRGCAKVGFELDHVRQMKVRLNTTRGGVRAAGEEDRRRWQEAVAPRARA